MKVLLTAPGHLRTVPMGDYVRRALTAMGCEVVTHNYGRDGWREAALKQLSRDRFSDYKRRQLLRIVEQWRPDVLLTIFGFNHDAQILAHLRSLGIATICWWLNDPFQFERSLAQADAYDFYFTNAQGSVEGYRAHGVTNAFYLPVGCCPEVHDRIPNCTTKYEIAFAGDWSALREEILGELSARFSVAILGPWRKKLARDSVLRQSIVRDGFFTPSDMVRLFNESKIVLNIHTWFGRWEYGTNPRLFEACGCGAFQLCDWKQEIPQLFEDDSEVALYRDVDDLKEKLARYLADDAKRLEIAERGYARAHRSHTYRARLDEMFAIAKLRER